LAQTHDIQEPVHLGWQTSSPAGAACHPTLTIVSLAIRQADHHRRRVAAQGDLSSHTTKRLCPEWDRAAFLLHRAETYSAGVENGRGMPRKSGRRLHFLER